MKHLNKSVFAGTLAAGLIALTSCSPIYRCGDPVPEKQKGGKRLQAVVMERDSLCTSLSQEEAANARLTGEKADLEKRLSRLDNQNDQQGRELNAQERELKNKERMLRDMQAIIARQDSMTRRLNNVLRDALLGFNSDELSVEIRDGKVYVSLSDKLLFKSGSNAVEAKGVEALKVLADVLNKNPDVNVLVEGHTDNVPIKTATYKDNWDLSVARATSITRILSEKYAVAPTRLTASGRGEFFPKAANDTQEGKAKNRRTEIILSPKLDEIMNLLNGSSASTGTGTGR
jgi:chemotaxis protein MotB